MTAQELTKKVAVGVVVSLTVMALINHVPALRQFATGEDRTRG